MRDRALVDWVPTADRCTFRGILAAIAGRIARGEAVSASAEIREGDELVRS